MPKSASESTVLVLSKDPQREKFIGLGQFNVVCLLSQEGVELLTAGKADVLIVDLDTEGVLWALQGVMNVPQILLLTNDRRHQTEASHGIRGGRAHVRYAMTETECEIGPLLLGNMVRYLLAGKDPEYSPNEKDKASTPPPTGSYTDPNCGSNTLVHKDGCRCRA